jgi:oxalate decarboxylase/phosphoglucose isomerase-like protein (cupin superfamily)
VTQTISVGVGSGQSDGAVFAFEVRMPPGGGPPMLHRHDPFELYRVDDGELAFYLEDEGGEVRRRVARAGEVVAIPGGCEHTIRNESDEEARAFVVFSPGETMESFVGAIASAGTDEVLALAAEHGIEMTRPLP